MTTPQNIAIIGAGMAAIACARTLMHAGHRVSVFEKSQGVGGRMATRHTAYGTFDHGAQYFTVRDPRFALALQTTPTVCKPWSANAVRVLDEHGRVTELAKPAREPHWVPSPGMNSLLQAWAQPLADATSLHLQTRVTRIERDALDKTRWQLRTLGNGDSSGVFPGFDAVLLAIPSHQAQMLLKTTPGANTLTKRIEQVTVAPCWTLMLAFPQAMQPGLTTLGPNWNAARSTHHRAAWLTRESSKPGRSAVERWTVQASAPWSEEHLQDDPARVQAKLIKAFSEVTGIHAQAAHVDIHRWLHAKTQQPLGKSYLWSAPLGLGVCGDWCLGHRVEDAFISGLELAMEIA